MFSPVGRFQAKLLPLLSFICGVGSILACYFLSQYYKQEKPFPDTWISATANHYPGYVVFRIGTISGSVLLILSHVTSYFWVMTIARQNAFNIGKYQPGYGTVMGITGAMFLMGSTATLDTGKHRTDWHVLCAGNCFAWSILCFWYHTFISWILYKKTKAVSYNSTMAKIILSLLILFQAILDSYAKLELAGSLYGSRLGNTLEYTVAFSIFAFFLIMAKDLKDFKMIYFASNK